MRIYLIRHAQTQGNLEKRYIGATDEPLSNLALAGFCNLTPPAVARIVVSPMLRCRQTAHLLYPGREVLIEQTLREYDFGAFEGKRHEDLQEDADYQRWIASMGSCAAPGGESMKAFKSRCSKGFQRQLDAAFEENLSSIAFITHGGTIMAILERFADPSRPFYDWQLSNLEGWMSDTAPLLWTEKTSLTHLQRIQMRG